jgi:1,4-dihydroxy-2-naphthoyl-CoA synthase
MMVYDMGRQYHAERVMSAGERRRADEQAGQLAASAVQLWRRYLTRPARALRILRVAFLRPSGSAAR